MDIARTILWLGKAFLVALAIFLGIGFAELFFNRVRGYQLVTLKSRMYWENDKAVAGEKVKTWKIAIPVDIWLQGNPQSWSLSARVPAHSSRKEDFETSRYVTTMTNVLPDNTLVPSTKGGSDAISFPLTLSNKIQGTAGGAEDYPAQSITGGGCSISSLLTGRFVNYRGWIVGVPPKEFSRNKATAHLGPNAVSDDLRVCAIVLKNLDQWTLHIDDLNSRDSGQ